MTVPSGPLTLCRVRTASTTATSGLNEADAIIGERRLRGAVDGLRLGTEVLHILARPCRKSPTGVTKVPSSANRDARSSAFFSTKALGKVISERANGCFVLSPAGTRRAGRTDEERTCDKRQADTLH